MLQGRFAVVRKLLERAWEEAGTV